MDNFIPPIFSMTNVYPTSTTIQVVKSTRKKDTFSPSDRATAYIYKKSLGILRKSKKP